MSDTTPISHAYCIIADDTTDGGNISNNCRAIAPSQQRFSHDDYSLPYCFC